MCWRCPRPGDDDRGGPTNEREAWVELYADPPSTYDPSAPVRDPWVDTERDGRIPA